MEFLIDNELVNCTPIQFDEIQELDIVLHLYTKDGFAAKMWVGPAEALTDDSEAWRASVRRTLSEDEYGAFNTLYYEYVKGSNLPAPYALVYRFQVESESNNNTLYRLN